MSRDTPQPPYGKMRCLLHKGKKKQYRILEMGKVTAIAIALLCLTISVFAQCPWLQGLVAAPVNVLCNNPQSVTTSTTVAGGPSLDVAISDLLGLSALGLFSQSLTPNTVYGDFSNPKNLATVRGVDHYDYFPGPTWPVSGTQNDQLSNIQQTICSNCSPKSTVDNSVSISSVQDTFLHTYWPGSGTATQGTKCFDVVNSPRYNPADPVPPLAAGHTVVLMQMQGVDVYWDNANPGQTGDGIASTTLGDKLIAGGYMSSNRIAGQYEYAQITSVTDSGATLHICVQDNLINSYVARTASSPGPTYSSAAKWQLIRGIQSTDITISAPLDTLPWDGSTGGVLVLDALTQIYFKPGGIVTASQRGFRGGGGQTLYPYNKDCSNSKSDSVTGRDPGKRSPGEGIAGTPFYTYNPKTTIIDQNINTYPKQWRCYSSTIGSGPPGSGATYVYNTGTNTPFWACSSGTDGTTCTCGSSNVQQDPSTLISSCNLGLYYEPRYPATGDDITQVANDRITFGNAGGHGVAYDAGGGGGANTGGGGQGGSRLDVNYSENCFNGGIGGAPYTPDLSHFVMGGGGGSFGDDNEDVPIASSSGGSGGGIILVRTTLITGDNGVTATFISNGGSVPDPGSSYTEGRGGGGAGGSISIYTVHADRAISATANGGDGGSTHQALDGGGGGGGGGYIAISSVDVITTLVTSSVAGGNQGLGGTTSSGKCGSGGQNGGSGSIGDGIATITSGVGCCNVGITVTIPVQQMTVPDIVITESSTGEIKSDGTPTVYFGDTLLNQPIYRQFVIMNKGTAPLILTDAAAPALPAGYAYDTSNPFPVNAVLQPNEARGFAVIATAASIGSFAGSFIVHSNDPDEAASKVTLDVNVVDPALPEIGVSEPVLGDLVSGSSSPKVDFGTMSLNSVSTKVFTIRNDAYGVLSVTGITFTNPSPGFPTPGFSITAGFPPFTLAALSSTTVTVSLSGSVSSAGTAEMRIANNDGNGDEIPFIIPLKWSIGEPQLLVKDPKGNIVACGSSNAFDFGTFVAGSIQQDRVFTIQNVATATNTLSVTSINSNLATFTIQTPTSFTIPVGSAVPRTISFNPTTVGSFTSIITIASNDPTYPSCTFPVKILVISGGPEIQVYDTDPITGDIQSGTTVPISFGNAPQSTGSSVTKTFTIKNVGSSDLTIFSDTITPNSGFTIPSPFTGIIPAGGTAPFTVLMSQDTSGPKSATISILSNDGNGDEIPFLFPVAGNVGFPEVGVTDTTGGGSVSLTDDVSIVDFGITPVGTPVTHTFTINNNGGQGVLAIGNLYPVPLGFTLTGFPANTNVAINAQSGTFSITFTAATEGEWWGEIGFFNNDADENPFTWTVHGIAKDYYWRFVMPHFGSIWAMYLPQTTLWSTNIGAHHLRLFLVQTSDTTCSNPVKELGVGTTLNEMTRSYIWKPFNINPGKLRVCAVLSNTVVLNGAFEGKIIYTDVFELTVRGLPDPIS